MARAIARENVSAELLQARFEEAGYETRVDDEGDLYILGTLVNLRIVLYPDYACMLIRGHLTLNSELSDEELQKIMAHENNLLGLIKQCPSERVPIEETLDRIYAYTLSIRGMTAQNVTE